MDSMSLDLKWSPGDLVYIFKYGDLKLQMKPGIIVDASMPPPGELQKIGRAHV